MGLIIHVRDLGFGDAHISIHRPKRTLDADFNEADHPRDEAGKFSAEEQGRAMRELKTRSGLNANRGKVDEGEIPIDESGVFPHNMQAGMNAELTRGEKDPGLDWSKAQLREVPRHKIVPTQHSVEAAQVEKFLRGEIKVPEGDLPTAVKHKGYYYLQDGHHRTAAALLAGRRQQQMQVLELEELPKHMQLKPSVVKDSSCGCGGHKRAFTTTPAAPAEEQQE